MKHKLWHKILETLPIASRAQSPREDEEQSPIAKNFDVSCYDIKCSILNASSKYYLIHLHHN